MRGRGAAAARMATVACALGCATLAAAPAPTVSPRLTLTSARGALRISSSHGGRAIVSAANMRPGESATGAVTVANRGGEARLFMRSSTPHDRPGPGGGLLSRRLELRVAEGRRRVAAGPVRAVAGCRALGRLAAGGRRRFLFTVRLRSGVATGNAYARSAAALDVRWLAGKRAACGGRRRGPTERREPRAIPLPERLPFTGARLALVLCAALLLLSAGAFLRCRLRSS